jgi:hypothetical protein
MPELSSNLNDTSWPEKEDQTEGKGEEKIATIVKRRESFFFHPPDQTIVVKIEHTVEL